MQAVAPLVPRPSKRTPSTRNEFFKNNGGVGKSSKGKGIMCEDDISVLDLSVSDSVIPDPYGYYNQESNKLFGKKTRNKFRQLSKSLPDYKIDVKLQLSIISTLKELDCWSDDEEDDISEALVEPAAVVDMSRKAIRATSFLLKNRHKEDDEVIIGNMLIGLNSGDEAFGDDVSAASSVTKDSYQIPLATLSRFNFNQPHSPPPPDINVNKFDQNAFLASRAVLSDSVSKPRRRVSIMEIKAKIQPTVIAPTPGKFVSTRDQIRAKILTKAVHIMAERHLEKKDQQKREKLREVMYGTLAYRHVMVHKCAVEWWKTLQMKATVGAITQMKRNEVLAEEYRERTVWAANVLHHAYRNYRLRKRWYFVLRGVHERLRARREALMVEENQFRMRAAYRRLKEDQELKQWRQKRREVLGLPPMVIPDLVGVVAKPLETPPQQESVEDARQQECSDPLPTVTSPRSVPTLPSKEEDGQVSLATAPTPTAPSVPNTKPRFKTSVVNVGGGSGARRVITDHEYARPDLAPFSTRINAMIQAKTFFKKEPTWEEIATVDDQYIASVKQNKSAAYKALQQLCGLSEQDIINRNNEFTVASSSKRNCRMYGASILSL